MSSMAEPFVDTRVKLEGARDPDKQCKYGHDVSPGSPDRAVRQVRGQIYLGCKECERISTRIKYYKKKQANMAQGDAAMGLVQFDHRTFQTTTVSEGSQSRRAYVVTCRQCGVKQMMTANNPSNTLPPEAIFNKFDRMGWRVEKNSSTHDLCPTCIRNVQIERKSKQSVRGLEELGKIFKPANGHDAAEEPAVVQAAETQQRHPLPEPPRPEPKPIPAVINPMPAMSREDRRIIFAKLNEVHQGEARGYKIGWSDAKVAADLGTPVGWVAMVRDEYFGQEGLSEENQQLVAEVRGLAERMREIDKRLEACEAAFKDATMMLKALKDDSLEAWDRHVKIGATITALGG